MRAILIIRAARAHRVPILVGAVVDALRKARIILVELFGAHVIAIATADTHLLTRAILCSRVALGALIISDRGFSRSVIGHKHIREAFYRSLTHGIRRRYLTFDLSVSKIPIVLSGGGVASENRLVIGVRGIFAIDRIGFHLAVEIVASLGLLHALVEHIVGRSYGGIHIFAGEALFV